MKKKIRFLLPAILCCLLVCGTAAGSHYAQGVSLMERALAAEEAYQSAGVVSAEELSQALEGEEAISTKGDLGRGGAGPPGARPLSWSPTLQAAWRSAFPKTARRDWRRPWSGAFPWTAALQTPSCWVGSPSPAPEVQVRFRADTWLSTIYSYLLEGAPRYTVEVLFSQCTYTVQMKQEDGQWKVASQDMDQLFAPDSYQPIQGGFASYQEALDFVNSLDVQALDPFVL